MKFGKGYKLLRNKFESLVVRKKSVKIHNYPFVNCPFIIQPSTKTGFFVCSNPYVIYLSKKKGNCSIIRCGDNGDCKYLRAANSKIKGDFIIVKNVIKKYCDKDGWLHIDSKLINKLIGMLKTYNIIYLQALLSYYGFLLVKDDHIDGLLFTNNSSYIKDNFAL